MVPFFRQAIHPEESADSVWPAQLQTSPGHTEEVPSLSSQQERLCLRHSRTAGGLLGREACGTYGVGSTINSK